MGTSELSPPYPTRTSRTMRKLNRLLMAGLLLCVAAHPLAAQTPVEVEVRGVIDHLFDGMRAGDSAVVRSTMHPEARLVTTAIRDGAPALRVESIDDFIRAVGTPHDAVWDERISAVEVRVDEPLATAWMDYRFYAGERFSHCGVNAFQLFRAADGWKIIQITDTRRASCDG